MNWFKHHFLPNVSSKRNTPGTLGLWIWYVSVFTIISAVAIAGGSNSW